jgi:hypothetical protein
MSPRSANTVTKAAAANDFALFGGKPRWVPCSFPVRNLDPAPACQIRPRRRVTAMIRVQRQHGVNQHATPHAFANLAQAAPAFRGSAEIDLAGILDC